MGRSDTELFKDKIEVSLDGRQIFFLFFGGAVIASLVFVLGVMVGKRVEARAHVERNATTSATLDPLAALDQLSADQRDEDLAFPAALTGGETASDMPLGAVDAQLTKATREEERARAKAEAEKKAAAEKAAAEKAAAEKAAAEKRAAEKAGAEKKAAEKAAQRAAADRAADDPSEDSDDSDADADAEKSTSKFTLQLSSFQDRAEAESFNQRIIRAGYTPYITRAEVPNKGTWYRVRLGSYDSYSAAVAAKKKFEAEQKIIAYVTRVKR